MMGQIVQEERNYNIEGLQGDYLSILTRFRNTNNKKERKQLATWLNKIKEILKEQGISPPLKKEE